MIAYCSRHSCKQLLKDELLSFGCRVWSLCTLSWYLVSCGIHQGKYPCSKTIYEEKFWICAAPLENMIDDFEQSICFSLTTCLRKYHCCHLRKSFARNASPRIKRYIFVKYPWVKSDICVTTTSTASKTRKN